HATIARPDAGARREHGGLVANRNVRLAPEVQNPVGAPKPLAALDLIPRLFVAIDAVFQLVADLDGIVGLDSKRDRAVAGVVGDLVGPPGVRACQELDDARYQPPGWFNERARDGERQRVFK